MEQKQCTKCKSVKLISEFSIIRNYVQSQCKDCIKTNYREYYSKNKERLNNCRTERYRQQKACNMNKMRI